MGFRIFLDFPIFLKVVNSILQLEVTLKMSDRPRQSNNIAMPDVATDDNSHSEKDRTMTGLTRQ